MGQLTKCHQLIACEQSNVSKGLVAYFKNDCENAEWQKAKFKFFELQSSLSVHMRSAVLIPIED